MTTPLNPGPLNPGPDEDAYGGFEMASDPAVREAVWRMALQAATESRRGDDDDVPEDPARAFTAVRDTVLLAWTEYDGFLAASRQMSAEAN